MKMPRGEKPLDLKMYKAKPNRLEWGKLEQGYLIHVSYEEVKNRNSIIISKQSKHFLFIVILRKQTSFGYRDVRLGIN